MTDVMTDARARIASHLLGLEEEERARVLPLLEALLLVEHGASKTAPAIVADLLARHRAGTLLPSLDDPLAAVRLQEVVRAIGTREERTLPRDAPKRGVPAGPLARARLNGESE